MALAERLQIFIETVGSGKAAADFRQVGGAAQGLAGQVKTGKLGLDGLASSAGISAGALKVGLVAGAAVAGAALVRFGSDSVGAFTDLAGSVRGLQRVMGGTAEDASRLIAVADDMAVPVETLSKSMFQLAKRIELSGASLASFGIEVVRTKDGTVDMSRTILSVAEAYNRTIDPGRRAALVNAAFGKSGQAMIPILEQTPAVIERMYASAEGAGQILSQEDIDKAEDLRLAMDNLYDATGKMQLVIGEALVPTMTKLAVATTTVVEALNSAKDAGKGFWEGLADKLGPVGDAFELIGVGNPMPWLGAVGSDGSDAADGLADVADAGGDVIDTADELEKVLLASTSAMRSQAQAARGVESANRRLGDAQKELNELLAEGAVDEEKVADARRSLAEATRSAADAGRGLAKAQREYDEAVAAAAALGGLDSALEEVADKAEGLADAQDSATSANERAEDAARELREAQAGDPDFQDKLAKARLGVRDATQGVADAEETLATRTWDAIKAHDAQTVALETTTDQAKALRSELELLVQTYPALAGLLNPEIAKLPAGEPVPLTSRSPVIPTLPFGAPQIPSATQTGGGLLTGATTNNIVINAPQQADPSHIARRMLWELN